MVQTTTLLNLDSIISDLKSEIQRLRCSCENNRVKNFLDNTAISSAIANGTLKEYDLYWNETDLCFGIVITIEGNLTATDIYCIP